MSLRRARRIATLAVATTALLLAGMLPGIAGDPAGAAPNPAPPPLTVDDAVLDAALHCPETFDDTREPVLLVHGTFTNDGENYGWNYRADLEGRGYDVCSVTLPDRSLNDIQIASEYVVYAVRAMADASGRQVDIIGHSQGGLEPRWAIRWWSDIVPLVDDLVMLAVPNHGTLPASFGQALCQACFQMGQGSDLIAALNREDETPGSISYTSIYSTLVDELVIPATSAELDGAVNVAVQDVCFGRPVDHVSIVADSVVHDLVLDALSGAGPVDVDRADPNCFAIPPTFVSGPGVVAALAVLIGEVTDPQVPAPLVVAEEPPLRWYADPAAEPDADIEATSPGAVVAGESVDVEATYENTGNVDLTKVTVAVPGAADCGPSVVGSLAVGADGAITCTIPSDLEPFARGGEIPVGATIAADELAPESTPTATVTVTLPEASWPDVATWYADAAGWLDHWDLATGYGDGSYRGGNGISRAALVRMLYRLAGRPDVDVSGPPPFDDVPGWVDGAVRWAAADPDGPGQPLVTGIAGRFEPDAFVTRAQVARMMHRYADSPTIDGSPTHGFTDVPAWVTAAVDWLATEAIITGIDGQFVPDQPVIRAQLARMLYRLSQALDATEG